MNKTKINDRMVTSGRTVATILFCYYSLSPKVAAEAISELKALGLDTEQNIARATRLERAGVSKDNIINVIKNDINSSPYIQKQILNFDEFSYLDEAQKRCIQSAINDGRVDISRWMGKVSGELDGLTEEEWNAVNKYLADGKNLYRIPESDIKTPDFCVDDINIEFKGIETSDLTNARSNSLQYAKDSFLNPPDGKGADRLVLDFASNTDISLSDAKNIAQEIKSLYNGKSVEVWTKEGDFTF